jgi:quinoprotein glucose dehydrogenase
MRILSVLVPLLLAVCSTVACLPNAAFPQNPPEPAPPAIQAASKEAELALNSFRIMDGVKGSLFAAEPMFANPVAFFVDDRGRVFVCETFRQGIAVVDNRDFNDEWVDRDLASNSVEDRRQYHLELLGDRAASFTEPDDQIRLLLDTDRDGSADESHVFANGFNDLVDGTGAGVLEFKGNVYYTCIPSLYLMRDENGDHQADGRAVLHTGFGVRVAFRGHDMHGLVIGPDGRLYFSIGDRGANVQTPEGQVVNVESGSVFRCELDGSHLELFATGLRNPQELAFDDHGNLFTGDNNSDSGDQARWVYVVEGGDSGWRMAYQYLPDRGPFNREKIWHPFHEGQPAYIVPAVANISDGPAGLDYYPGTGFGDLFKNSFLLADFRGTANQSGIRSIRNEPDGAFFRIAEDGQPFWQILATDVQFGPDGAVYISDWVNGWEGEGKGRLYRFVSPEHANAPIVKEVQRILASEITEVDNDTLANYLGHADRRVRLKAQLELAMRGDLARLAQAASSGESILKRLHGLWGLDYISRRAADSQDRIRQMWIELASDEQAEIRAHAVRLLGEIGGSAAHAVVRDRLQDNSPRVRYFALMATGKLQTIDALAEVVQEVENNAGRDPILRHGGIMAMASTASPTALAELKTHRSKQVRLAAVVALRRMNSDLVAVYLHDPDQDVVAEAARAIHDLPMGSAMDALAELIEQPLEDEAVVRRTLNANFRLGTAAHASAVAHFAAGPSHAQAMREEALDMLGDWQRPGGRDRVLGMWRPLPPRSPGAPRQALESVLPAFTDAEPQLRLRAGQVASGMKISSSAALLRSVFNDMEFEPEDRAQALVALIELDAGARADVERALQDDASEVRAAALGVVRQVMPEAADEKLAHAALEGQVLERQMAIKALATADAASRSLLRVLQAWADGELPPEVQLEALQAAQALSADPRVAAILEKKNSTRDPNKPLDVYREALYGGDARRGRRIFQEKVSVSCVRCHKVFTQGGEVGPELTRIAVDKDRPYLLEALVDPNKVIAKGYESALLLDLDGNVFTGVVREETESTITLIDAEGKIMTFDKQEIEARNPAKVGNARRFGQ